MSRFRAAAGHATAPLPSRQAKTLLSILVAEDDPVTQDLLKFLIVQRGHHVDVVDDGEKARRALREHHYAMVLIAVEFAKAAS